jgi:Xaa-Pro aminopeptidase
MADLIWLTGFGGTSGLALIGPEDRLFLTDFRYAERAQGEVPPSFERVQAERQLLGEVAGRLRGRVGYDDERTSVRVLRKLDELAPEGVELVPAGGLAERLRRVKDERERRAIAEAARLGDEVFASLEQQGLVGRTEHELAVAAELRMRELGAEAVAFPPIVASASNGALPHAESGKREIGRGELVVVDLGATLDGYCADCTRTLAAGAEPGGEAKEVYELVLRAQGLALAQVRPGVAASAVDGAAREVIAAAGHAERFGHGVGHGVGIEIHEPPRLSKSSEEELLEGDVVTIEPGVYLPGRFGVRIEDLVAVTAEGYLNMSTRDKGLRVVG